MDDLYMENGRHVQCLHANFLVPGNLALNAVDNPHEYIGL